MVIQIAVTAVDFSHLWQMSFCTLALLSQSDWTMVFVQNQLILGVMGVDVHLDELKRLAPRFNVSYALVK